MTQITFKDLSWPIKAAVVTSWVIGILYILLFLAGFLLGVVSP